MVKSLRLSLLVPYLSAHVSNVAFANMMLPAALAVQVEKAQTAAERLFGDV
jgi:hypothetical protein